MRILVLDIPPDAGLLARLAGLGDVSVAHTSEQADRLLARGEVDIVIAGPTSWGRGWVAALPFESRPAVVLTGSPGERALAEADEWIADETDAAELAARLRVSIRRARLRRRSVRRGNIDPLTSLPNRRGAMVALLRGAARSRRQGARLSLVLIDLDDFKRVNDLSGHDAGDRVLRKVGRALRNATRQDEACARIGGDEFAVVVVGDAHHAELVCRRVTTALAAEAIAVTCASGELVASESLRDLYRRVDAQLRARKRQARTSAVRAMTT
jgi:diguanylate cyclase (GGDEF)-like protein